MEGGWTTLDTVKSSGSDDPRPRRGDRGSGFARARKQSQAVIVGGVSLEAVPATREDDAETASIIVNRRKGLYEHGHSGDPAVPVNNRSQHLNMVPRICTRRQGSCLASTEHFQQCAEFPPLRNRGLGPLAVTVLPIPFARRAAATACASGSAHLDGGGRVSV